MVLKVGVAGLGAIGTAVCTGLVAAMEGLALVGVSEIVDKPLPAPRYDFESLTEHSDVVVECLSPSAVPELAGIVLGQGKTLVLISSGALLRDPDLFDLAQKSSGKLIVPSGALVALDGVRALCRMGDVQDSRIVSTKRPAGFAGAPYVTENRIDLSAIATKTRLFEGNAREAARGFPANVNVAATLSLAGIGAEKTRVEIWADPAAVGNTHEICVRSRFSTITAKVENLPDPANPKSSLLAAQSVLVALSMMTEKITVL